MSLTVQRTIAEGIGCKSPAKINLFLDVVGKRANGYHDIQSIIMPVSLADDINIEITGGAVQTTVEIENGHSCCDFRLPDSESNIATKIARALQKETGCQKGAKIHITKRIPVGGGMGGGSSNAATVLMTLDNLWGTGLSGDRLISIGASIGCDIPAFIIGKTVMVEGVGDIVRTMKVSEKCADWWVTMVNPGFQVPTADIYTRYDSVLTSSRKDINNISFALKTGDFGQAAEGLFNGLQDTVFRKYPLIAVFAEALSRAGSEGVLLCGSGASLFGLARSEAQAREVEARLNRDLGVDAWTAVARLLPDGVMVAHGPLEARV